MRFRFSLIFFILLFASGIINAKEYPRRIRVLVKENTALCSLYSLGDLRYISGEDTALNKGTVYISVNGDSIQLRNKKNEICTACRYVDVYCSNKSGFIEVDDLKYRGQLRIIVSGPGRFQVINTLDIEDYLRGVVPFEIGRHKSDVLEALKTQAVAARTYTVKRVLETKKENRPFDVYADIKDQVYKGISGEYLFSDRAIKETVGVTVFYKGNLTECYYSSTCGGRTSNIGEVWRDKPKRKYLSSVSDRGPKGDFCKSSKYHRWSYEWTYDDLNRMIKTYLPKELPEARNCGNLKKIKILKRTTSGRIAKLMIKTENGKYYVRGDRVRWVLRRKENEGLILYSANFEIEEEPQVGKSLRYTAKGKGWGHGVGMCQVGALGMARQGYKYEQILKHYYKGVELKKLW